MPKERINNYETEQSTMLAEPQPGLTEHGWKRAGSWRAEPTALEALIEDGKAEEAPSHFGSGAAVGRFKGGGYC